MLPLNLYYLISAGEEDQKDAHDKLGQAMLTFHDHPELTDFNANSGIKNQTDPIRATPQPLNLDEISKLWSSFQTPYRPSVAYEVGVVLIESEIPESSPLPVSRRGDDGTGWDASTQFPPVLTAARFQTKNQYGARLGETVTLTGANLSAYRNMRIAFRHPLREREKLPPFLESPKPVTEQEVDVKIPDEPNTWPAGVYMVRVQDVPPVGDQRASALPTNDIPLLLLPDIVVPAGGLKAVHDTASNRSLAVPCRPKLMAGQRVQILIGSVVIDDVDVSNPDRPVGKWNVAKVTFPAGEHVCASAGRRRR